ncbi:MAG TPA: bifunctional riboflavin kinase/FAD synthetase [Thermoanaerobacterales bacterium]|nr:bifunctional riboflavin kinase/FAD synthetase [Thermoanaerobacterales bacterium]
MRIYKNISSLQMTEPTVCGLGNFDGVHLGHQKLIKQLVDISRDRDLKPTIFTFEPHPANILCPDKSNLIITPVEKKQNIMKSLGVENLIMAPFTPDFARIEYDDFISEILVKRCRAKAVVVGFDYRFGYKGRGNAQILKQVSRDYGIDTHIVEPVTYSGKIVSSTLIRSLIKKGDVKSASEFLGYPFGISGNVILGNRVGRKLGFPTANVNFPSNIVLPANGVYAVFVSLSGKLLKGAANIGFKPTFGGNNIVLEVHLFDFCKQIYGERLEVFFIENLRKEIKFKSPKELIAQVNTDFNKANEILNKYQKDILCI